MAKPKTRNRAEDLKLPEVAPVVDLCDKFIHSQVALKNKNFRGAVIARIGDRFVARFTKTGRWTVLHTSISGVYALPLDWREAENKRRYVWSNQGRTNQVDIIDLLDALSDLGLITAEAVATFRAWRRAEIDLDYAKEAVSEASAALREAEKQFVEAVKASAKTALADKDSARP